MNRFAASWVLFFVLILGFLQNIGNANEIKEVKFYTAPFGSTAYLVALQLATEINRSHPWLRLTVIVGKPINLHELANKPQLRKNTIVSSPTFTKWACEQGKLPAKAPYHGAKALTSITGILAAPVFTLDSNIRTIQDLKGKRVNLFAKGTQGQMTLTALLKHIGIFDDIKKDYLGFRPSVDSLTNGTIDATLGFAGVVKRDPVKFSPIAGFIKLLETKQCYLVDIPKHTMRETSRQAGIPISPIQIPAGSLGKNTPKSDINTFCTYIWLFADESFPEELAYEICKEFEKHMDSIKKTSPVAGALTVKKMATADLTPEEYHLGARRYFKERGIEIVNEAK